jgi:hypothetical protein
VFHEVKIQGCSCSQGLTCGRDSCAARWASWALRLRGSLGALRPSEQLARPRLFGIQIRASLMSHCLPCSSCTNPTHSHGIPASLVSCCRIGSRQTSVSSPQPTGHVSQCFRLPRPKITGRRGTGRYVVERLACSKVVPCKAVDQRCHT